jgi:terminase large subunit-like protein
MDEVARRLLAIKSHPKYFLKYCTFTKDGNDMVSPCKPFPYHLPYHQAICDAWFESPLTMIIKSRQMQETWFALAAHLWLALTGPDREIYFRRQTFDDALKLLDDTKYIYDHIPEAIWPKSLLPQLKTKEGMLVFPDINTTIFAVSEGKDKMRGRTPSAVLLDEFAFQTDDAMVWQTLKPSVHGGAKVTIITTPKPLFGGENPYAKRILEDTV